MCKDDFFNMMEGCSINEPRTDEFEGKCPIIKQDVIFSDLFMRVRITALHLRHLKGVPKS